MRVCAAGCDASPAPAASDAESRQLAVHLSRWARWARMGATTFLVGFGVGMLPFAALSLVGYSASLLCISVAWRRRRHPYRYARWSV